MNKKSKYEVGETLIARQWIKQPRVNNNIRYIIVEIGHDKLIRSTNSIAQHSK